MREREGGRGNVGPQIQQPQEISSAAVLHLGLGEARRHLTIEKIKWVQQGSCRCDGKTGGEALIRSYMLCSHRPAGILGGMPWHSPRGGSKALAICM